MKHVLIIALALACIAVGGTAQAGGDAQAGKEKAASCGGCHGANGEGKDPYPALAGKSEAELVQAITEYKTGQRKNAIMKKFATGLGDQDIVNVAAYYASLKGK